MTLSAFYTDPKTGEEKKVELEPDEWRTLKRSSSGAHFRIDEEGTKALAKDPTAEKDSASAFGKGVLTSLGQLGAETMLRPIPGMVQDIPDKPVSEYARGLEFNPRAPSLGELLTGPQGMKTTGPGSPVLDAFSGAREEIGRGQMGQAGLAAGDMLGVLTPAAAGRARSLQSSIKMGRRELAKATAAEKAPEAAAKRIAAEHAAELEALNQLKAKHSGRASALGKMQQRNKASESSALRQSGEKVKEARRILEENRKEIGKKIKGEIEPAIVKTRATRQASRDTGILDPSGKPVVVSDETAIAENAGRAAQRAKLQALKKKLLKDAQDEWAAFRKLDVEESGKRVSATEKSAANRVKIARAQAAEEKAIQSVNERLAALGKDPRSATADDLAAAERSVMAEIEAAGLPSESKSRLFQAVRDTIAYYGGKMATGSHFGGIGAKQFARTAASKLGDGGATIPVPSFREAKNLITYGGGRTPSSGPVLQSTAQRGHGKLSAAAIDQLIREQLTEDQ